VVGILVFFDIRVFMVRRSFGEYGHYRGDEVAQAAALPIAYARHQTFEECHLDVLGAKRKGKHAGVACEACHGPQAKHREDPVAVLPRGSHRRSQALAANWTAKREITRAIVQRTELEPTSLPAVHWQTALWSRLW